MMSGKVRQQVLTWWEPQLEFRRLGRPNATTSSTGLAAVSNIAAVCTVSIVDYELACTTSNQTVETLTSKRAIAARHTLKVYYIIATQLSQGLLFTNGYQLSSW
jgi:hypothetical protein